MKTNKIKKLEQELKEAKDVGDIQKVKQIEAYLDDVYNESVALTDEQKFMQELCNEYRDFLVAEMGCETHNEIEDHFDFMKLMVDGFAEKKNYETETQVRVCVECGGQVVENGGENSVCTECGIIEGGDK